jgi:hypothetical protein
MSNPPTEPPFFFCIPLMPKANAGDWGQVCRVFQQTIRSLENQRNQNFKVLLAAQDLPDFFPEIDLDIVHIHTPWTVEDDKSHKLRDKRWKKTSLLRYVRQAGGGYVMMLDADDLVSDRLVEYVLQDRNENGYIIENGYAYDWKADLIAPIPGVWGKTFDSVCGSCSVIYFKPEDLPPPTARDPSEDGLYLAAKLKQHAQWKHVMEDARRPLEVIPFPGAVYVLNHDNNLHYSIAPDRRAAVPRKIRSRQIPITSELRAEFCLPNTTS